MKRMLVIVAAFAVLAPLAANAQERMSDSRYLAASRCLAYADLEQLQSDPADFSALREAAEVGRREPWIDFWSCNISWRSSKTEKKTTATKKNRGGNWTRRSASIRARRY